MTTRSERTAKRPEMDAVYSDFMGNFNAHPNTGELMVRKNEEAVKRSLRNLLMTDKGERFFNRSLGTNIKSILFEPPTSINQQQLKTVISEAIERFEKRVFVKDIVVTLKDNEQTYNIDIYFSIINSPETHTFNVKLDRIR